MSKPGAEYLVKRADLLGGGVAGLPGTSPFPQSTPGNPNVTNWQGLIAMLLGWLFKSQMGKDQASGKDIPTLEKADGRSLQEYMNSTDRPIGGGPRRLPEDYKNPVRLARALQNTQGDLSKVYPDATQKDLLKNRELLQDAAALMPDSAERDRVVQAVSDMDWAEANNTSIMDPRVQRQIAGRDEVDAMRRQAQADSPSTMGRALQWIKNLGSVDNKPREQISLDFNPVGGPPRAQDPIDYAAYDKQWGGGPVTESAYTPIIKYDPSDPFATFGDNNPRSNVQIAKRRSAARLLAPTTPFGRGNWAARPQKPSFNTPVPNPGGYAQRYTPSALPAATPTPKFVPVVKKPAAPVTGGALSHNPYMKNNVFRPGPMQFSTNPYKKNKISPGYTGNIG